MLSIKQEQKTPQGSLIDSDCRTKTGLTNRVFLHTLDQEHTFGRLPAHAGTTTAWLLRQLWNANLRDYST